jgi:hypothetical protein
MVSYCSLLNDRLSTKLLIENSKNDLLECSHNFMNKSEWVDGLDLWLSNDIIKKTNFSKTNFHFDENIGIYLPKLNSKSIQIQNDFIDSKQLTEKENNSSEISSSDQSLSISDDNHSISKSSSLESSTKHRLPFRQIESQNNSQGNIRDKFQYILKEQLTSLLTHEKTNLSLKRPVIKLPSVQIIHENLRFSRSNTQIDQKTSKVEKLIISPLLLKPISRLGLTVTPLDVPSSLYQQESPSIEQTNQEKYILLKENFQKGFILSSTNIYLSTKNSNDEQIQTHQKSSHHPHIFSKHKFKRTKSFQLLPHITGKRIQINSNNQNNS